MMGRVKTMSSLSLATLMTVLDTLPNAVFVKGADLRFTFINRAYEKMFGVSRKDVLGKTVLDLEYLPEEDRKMYQSEDREMVRRQEVSHHVRSYLFADGKEHTCLYWSGGFEDENGVRGLLGVIVDIAEQSHTIGALRSQLDSMITRVRQADESSLTDALTGLYTRKYLDMVLGRYTRLEKKPFCCIMLDVDHFKQINDSFGHLVGDSVLKDVAQVIRRCVREMDTVCRYGGEEFVVLMPGSLLEQAEQAAERIRRAVSGMISGPDSRPVTVSLGCSEYEMDEDALQVLHRADKALYGAKRSGRNRVWVARRNPVAAVHAGPGCR
uniref:diguanylate cyclase n=1 Tax=Desulfovibrio desulfuricans (strain ATCC 27774 / DSM 6949 / MB) TaxID=525146 RepID=B8J4U6_DESDA